MPGELERLIIAIMQPKPSTTASAPNIAQLQFDKLAPLASDTVQATMSPNSNWGTARWSEATWQ